jgi:DNA-binding XRE family transcriptional regulator
LRRQTRAGPEPEALRRSLVPDDDVQRLQERLENRHEMNAAHAIRRLEEVGFTHQQATGVVEIIQGEVIEKVATRDYVGEQVALVRKDLAEQIGAVRQEIGTVRQDLAEQIGTVRQEVGAVRQEIGTVRQDLAEQIGTVRQELAAETASIRTELAHTRTELLHAINRLAFWMNGFLAALLVAVLGICGVLIGKL